MRRIVALILFLSILVLLLAACGEPETYLIRELTTHVNNNIVVERRYQYDAERMLLGYSLYQDGSLSSNVEYGYDENGYRNYEKLSSPSVDYVSEIFSELDSEGRPIRQRYLMRYEDIEREQVWYVEYTDAYGSYTERTAVGGEEITQSYIYDENGNLLRSELTGGKVTEYANEYGENGKLLRVTTTVDGSSTVAEYEYSEDGGLVTERLYDSQGELVRIVERYYSENPEIRE